MKRSHWWGPCLALLVLVPRMPAQEKSPLAQVPAQAPIVIHLKGVERTKGRLVTLINNALPDLGKQVQETIEDTLKGELGERQLKGLAPFGPVFIVFTEMPRAEQDVPAVAVVLRVTDAKTFRAGFFTEQERKTLAKHPDGYESLTFKDEPAYLLERGEYLVFTPKKEALTPFLKPDKGLDGKLGAEAAKRLLDNDLGIYVDLGEVYRTYGQTVRDARQFLDLGLQQAGGAVDKEQIAMIKAIADSALQGFEDSRGLLLTADFRPDGLAVHAQVKFGGDSKTNQFLKLLAPGDLKAVETLPAGQMTYTAVKADAALAKPLAIFLQGVGADTESNQGKAIQKALDAINDAGPRDLLQAVGVKMHGVIVSRYQDAAKAARGQLQLFQALTEGGSYNQLKIKKAALKQEDQKHRGFTLHHANLVWDFEKMMEAQPGGSKEAADAMRKLMGESLNVWFGSDGKVVAQVMAKDWAEAQKLLDSYLDGKTAVGQEQAFQEVRKHLPPQANLLIFYDVPQLVQYMANMVATTFGALGQGEVKLPPATEKPKAVFVGAALTLKGEHLSVDVWVPTTAVREAQKMLDPLIRAFGG